MSKLQKQFARDVQGHKFADVMADTRIRFNDVLDFLDDGARRQRMLESELHHDRAPLAAVVRELEARPDVAHFLSSHDAHTTTRFRQAVGVAVRIVMEDWGWATTKRKGSLGTRVAVRSGTTTPGAYRNSSTSLATWFLRAERYEPTPDAKVQRLAQTPRPDEQPRRESDQIDPLK